jgi:hypothetical protein
LLDDPDIKGFYNPTPLDGVLSASGKLAVADT